MALPFEPPPTAGTAATLEGVLERVVFANEENAWCVVRLSVAGQRDAVTAVGNLLGVQPGESLRLTGSWVQDPKYGRQFRVASYLTVAPATLGGIEKYLCSGLIRCIGKGLAALAANGQAVIEALPAAPADPAEAAVYLKALHTAEAGIAARVRTLLVQPPLPFEIDLDRALEWFARAERIALAPQQRQAVRAGLTRKVLVITGGPGTGKTTLVRGIVRILERKGQRVLLAAPTGRAAKRLAEATGGAAGTP